MVVWYGPWFLCPIEIEKCRILRRKSPAPDGSPSGQKRIDRREPIGRQGPAPDGTEGSWCLVWPGDGSTVLPEVGLSGQNTASLLDFLDNCVDY